MTDYEPGICDRCGHVQDVEHFELFCVRYEGSKLVSTKCCDCDDLVFGGLPEGMEVWQFGQCISHPEKSPPKQLELPL